MAASGDTQALGSIWSSQTGHGGGQPRPGGSLHWKPFVLPGVQGVCCRRAEPGRDESGSGGNRSSHAEAPVASARVSCSCGAGTGRSGAGVCRPGTEVPDVPSQHPECRCPWERVLPTRERGPGLRCSASRRPSQGPEPAAAPRAGPRAPGHQHGPERGARAPAGLAAEPQLPGAARGAAAARGRLQVPESCGPGLPGVGTSGHCGNETGPPSPQQAAALRICPRQEASSLCLHSRWCRRPVCHSAAAFLAGVTPHRTKK